MTRRDLAVIALTALPLGALLWVSDLTELHRLTKHPISCTPSTHHVHAAHHTPFRRSHKRKKMIAKVYYYYTLYATSGGSVPTEPISVMTIDPGLLYDGAVGDTTTGYSLSGFTAGKGYGIYGVIDLGTPVACTQCSVTYTVSNGASDNEYLQIFGCNDGISWTPINTINHPPGGTATIALTGSYRYYEVINNLNAFANGSPMSLTDFRLYDNTGTIIGPPGSNVPQNYIPTNLRHPTLRR